MKRKYHLKQKVKEDIIFGIFVFGLISFFFILLIFSIKRIEDINSGKIILIHQNY